MPCILTVRVIPRSKKQSCGYDRAGRISIHLRSAPEQGAANDELIRYVADQLNIPYRTISLISGTTARIKRLSIDTAMTLDELYRKLGLEKGLQGTLGDDGIKQHKKNSLLH